MGKTHNNASCATVTKRPGSSALSGPDDRSFLQQAQMKVGIWEQRSRVETDSENQEEYFRLRAQALKKLTRSPESQRELIAIAQKSKARAEELAASSHPDDQRIAAQARRISDRSRELLILCHYGIVSNAVWRRAHLLKGETLEDARAVLRQEAWAGIDRAIDSYQFDAGANPITYFRQGQIRHFLSKAVEREGGEAGMRLKARASELGKKINEQANKIENENRQVTIAELAEKIKEPPEKIAEILPLVQNRAIRMDAPVSSDEQQGSTLGERLVDQQADTEQRVLELDAVDRVREAIGDIESPFRRRLLEMTYGLDGEEVEQKDTFDGVYVDQQGQAFSAETTIISDRRARGTKVQKEQQSELNRRFRAGELKFEPGTKEAYELSRIAHGDFNPQEAFAQFITAETGLPPTSGTIYEAKRQAERELRSNPRLSGIVDPYRGDDQLENSESAREIVRWELFERGVISNVNDKALQARNSSGQEKSLLRQLAEQHQLVDQRGRITI